MFDVLSPYKILIFDLAVEISPWSVNWFDFKTSIWFWNVFWLPGTLDNNVLNELLIFVLSVACSVIWLLKLVVNKDTSLSCNVFKSVIRSC